LRRRSKEEIHPMGEIRSTLDIIMEKARDVNFEPAEIPKDTNIKTDIAQRSLSCQMHPLCLKLEGTLPRSPSTGLTIETA
ncbi:MAG: hypothetical protein KJ573_09495, partial [Proteobacteria bacterium]|nr:hypothetical protein [Pseudomonadota bacterium]